MLNQSRLAILKAREDHIKVRLICNNTYLKTNTASALPTVASIIKYLQSC